MAEGLVAMLGPFIDTIIICTITALIILTNRDALDPNAAGIVMTTQAFAPHFGQFSTYLMTIIIFCFSFTTLLGMANYNQKCFYFFFQKSRFCPKKMFMGYYLLSVIAGALWSMDDVVNLLDIGFACMAFPNMFTTLYLAKKVLPEIKEYFAKYT